jgi:ribose transport system permease protein
LRGGEGSILGVLIGATLMQVLRNTITLVTTHNNVEFAIIGAVILLGVVADELTRRFAARRRAAKALQKSPSQ